MFTSVALLYNSFALFSLGLNLVAGLDRTGFCLINSLTYRRDKVLLVSRDSNTRLLNSRKPRLAVDQRLTRSLIHL